MKRFVIVGLGTFGAGVAESLYEQGHEVIAVDVEERRVERATPFASRAVVGDGRQYEVLKRIGAEGADGAVVSTGDDMSASILAVMSLRDLGIQAVYAKVISLEHDRIMRKIGATETVFPERESSLNLAVRMVRSSALRNYIRLGHGFSLQEMEVPKVWEGKTLRELSLPRNYQISVVAIHDLIHDRLIAVPDPDQPLLDAYSLIVTGAEKSLLRVARL